MRQRILEHPDDPLSRMQLSTSYALHGDYEKAVEEGKIAICLVREKGIRDANFASAFYNVAQGCFVLGAFQEAEEYALEAARFYKYDLNAYHFLASIYFQRSDWPRCGEMVLKYLEARAEIDGHPERMESIYFVSHEKRYEILFFQGAVNFMEGAIDKADECFLMAFEEEGRLPERAARISRFFLDHGIIDKALKWFELGYTRGFRDSGFLARFSDACKAAQRPDGDAAFPHEQNDDLEIILLQAWRHWIAGDLERFLEDMERAMKSVGMDTNVIIDSLEDVGSMVLAIARRLCNRCLWRPTEVALGLALLIAPQASDLHPTGGGFPPLERFA